MARLVTIPIAQRMEQPIRNRNLTQREQTGPTYTYPQRILKSRGGPFFHPKQRDNGASVARHVESTARKFLITRRARSCYAARDSFHFNGGSSRFATCLREASADVAAFSFPCLIFFTDSEGAIHFLAFTFLTDVCTPLVVCSE